MIYIGDGGGPFKKKISLLIICSKGLPKIFQTMLLHHPVHLVNPVKKMILLFFVLFLFRLSAKASAAAGVSPWLMIIIILSVD
jgi:hypothetical protein